jgi:hypothetical protein
MVFVMGVGAQVPVEVSSAKWAVERSLKIRAINTSLSKTPEVARIICTYQELLGTSNCSE